jgi:predicted PurR-regulated permease PerM
MRLCHLMGKGDAMALPVREQVKYWGAAAAVFLLLLYVLGNVILPFLVGGAMAYFLDPVADRLERAGLSRTAATAVIALVATLIVVLAVLAIIPTLINQAVALVNAAPEIARRLQGFLLEKFPQLADSTSTMRQALADIGATVQSKGGELVNAVFSSALGVVSAVVFLLVVPVVAFYMLLDWDHMIERIDSLLPRDHAPVIRRLAREIDAVLAGFVRGQVSVCLLLGLYYSVALMLAGLQFGLIVGAIAGTITFIPYVGALVGGVLAIGLALFQFWGEWVSIGVVAAIFAVGQFIEGNILTPKLVGRSVGLHPVWLLFALSVFGVLFGFVGMLVAVPVAASLGVLTRFAAEQYRQSLLFTGREGPAAATHLALKLDVPPEGKVTVSVATPEETVTVTESGSETAPAPRRKPATRRSPARKPAAKGPGG